jgi:two-component sensor histidine kinase
LNRRRVLYPEGSQSSPHQERRMRLIALPALACRRTGGLPLRSVFVIALLLVLILLFTGLAALHIRERYHEAIERGETRAMTAAQTAAAHVRWLMEANLQALARMDQELIVENGRVTGARREGMEAIADSLPGDAGIRVFDAEGEMVAMSEPGATPASIADREHFQALRDGREWQVSKLLAGNGDGDGRKVFVVARRIARDGAFLGTVMTVVPIDTMGRLWAALDLGPYSSVGLVRDDGWLVARHPQPEDALDLSGHPLFTEYLPRTPAGFYHSPVSPEDGIARIVGYERVEGLPLVAVVGISRDWALARFRESATAMATLGIPAMLVLVGLTAWIAVLLRRDEDARRRDEELRARLTQALEHNRMLVREAYHRVKNNLQTVSSMLQLGPGSAETKAEMTRRIQAMAALHEQVYLSDQFETVRLDEHIAGTVERLRDSHPDAAELHCELDPVEVQADRALPLALIVSEVASNALKHAFPDQRKGSVGIALRRQGTGRAVLSIVDDGIGFRPGEGRGGLGMRLVRAFAQEVDGEASFRSDAGTRFTLEFPV